jgi:hypothetical protein
MTSKAQRLSGLAKELDALAAASSSTLIVYEYTATAGQTVFSGADNNGLTLNYIPANTLVVYNEGVLQKTVDYATTSSDVLTLTSGAEVGALVRMYAFGTFAVADVYTKAEDDARFVQKANIVGVVSQSGGIPTGAILQSSWGAGGGYIKYADGTMIQVIKRVVTRDINQAYGSMFITPAAEAAQNWPIPFVSLVFETASVIGESLSCWWAGVGYGTVTQTQAGFLYSAITRASSSYTIVYRAEGRWF